MSTAIGPDAANGARKSAQAGPSDTARNVFTFLFGAFVYLAVWLILIYIVCFVGNYFGPLIDRGWGELLPLKSIDMGVQEPVAWALAIDVLLIVILGLQHSIMPRPWFKRLITRSVPPHLERSTYIIFAICALSLLMWQWRPITQTVWNVENPTLRLVLNAIQLCGWLTVLIATFQVGHWKIFGVTQVLDYIRGVPYTRGLQSRLPNEFFETGWPVTDKGLWYFARHPDFFGFCVAFWVTPTMTVGHLVFAAGLTVYIMIGIFFLETNLKELYGVSYEEYVRVRSKIIPWWVSGAEKRSVLYRVVKRSLGVAGLVVVAGVIAFSLLSGRGTPDPGTVSDEALRAGRTAESFPAADEDYFQQMDDRRQLSADEIKGRNMWLVWSGGNDRFWDEITKHSFGTFDLLKIVSSHPSLKFSRDNRWNYLGAVNEPCFERASGPDPQRFGLWLDRRRADCAADPFADPQKYPGVKIGARGDGAVAVGSFYGEPTGIVGLRLFPNPNFDEKARKAWDADRYYNDASYYARKDIVRPYRVGMACGFCHVGPSPTNPPRDAENPAWENLNSTVGAQYLWFDRVFAWDADASNFVFQLLHTYPPGTLDTSLVSSDDIINPRTMNALYNLGARVEVARRFDPELLTGGQLNNAQFNDFADAGDLSGFYQRPYVWTPRILKDGSDSVGPLGALNRVYLNIGLFSEEWLLHFSPFIGLKRLTPMPIATAESMSTYWRATERQTYLMARFLLAAGKPDPLEAAPGGKAYLDADKTVLDRGKVVFAERCARCHSSKLPRPLQGLEGPRRESCSGQNYLSCWNTYWAWTKSDDFKRRMTEIVAAPDFLSNNFLSTDLRVPTTLLQTNACSALATNALAGNIWDNFSSQSYKDLPAVGEITVRDPSSGEAMQYRMPAGGRGYTRPASLVSLWSTAPYLLNNRIGPFDPSPSVEARVRSFEAGIEQMLWPERRPRDAVLGAQGVGLIDRTTTTSWLKLPKGYLPGFVSALRRPINWLVPNAITANGDLRIGPIPKGTPVALLGSFGPLSEDTRLSAQLAHGWAVLKFLVHFRSYLAALTPEATEDESRKLFAPVARDLYAMSKCPDLVVNRGHYFGTDLLAEEPGLADADKRALIEFLKTL